MKDTVLYVLMLIVVKKFSREFLEETRSSNCWIRRKASNSRENLMPALMEIGAEELYDFRQIGTKMGAI